jgi:hypothetical protein
MARGVNDYLPKCQEPFKKNIYLIEQNTWKILNEVLIFTCPTVFIDEEVVGYV